jgi:nucleoside-diphosphate-sugar epimerase
MPDLADALVLAATAAMTGHEVVYIAAADNIGNRDLAAAVAAAYGGRVPVQPLSRPDASGLSCVKAEKLLGWTPKLTWRAYLDPVSGRLLPSIAALGKGVLTAEQLLPKA